MGNGATFPEWERARQNARPEDDAQKRLVALLEQPIDASETKKLAIRKKQLQALVDGLPQTSAHRMHERVADPKDPLGQFMTFELSTPLHDDLVNRLAARDKVGARGTDQQQRGTAPTSTGVSGGFPFMFLPPMVIPFPGITSPQYFPNGFPPIGIFGRPVLLVPEAYPPAQTKPKDKKKPPPPPPPPPKRKPQDRDPKDNDKDKDRKKPPVLPPVRTGPGMLDWLKDTLTHASHSAALMIGGLLVTLPADAVSAALAAALAVFGEGGTAARAGEMAAKEMLKWTLKQKGLAQHVFDLNNISKRFPGVDLISSIRPWQIKMWGVKGTGSKFDVAMKIANEMVLLFDDHPAVRLPTTTATELLKARHLIAQHGAWPASWPANPTVDQMKVLLRDTAFGVPDDLVVQVRGAFAKRLIENPKLRELIPDVSLGSLVDPNTLSRTAQVAWGERVTKFLFDHVVGVGATTDQLRTFSAAAELLASP